MNRILLPLFLILLLLVCLSYSSESNCLEKPHYKVLYSNDVTHIVSCVSPYHKKGENFTKEMIEASVMETANTGVDVHMLQPGLGWIPWWKSKVYPAEQHYKWFKERTGLEPDSFGQYMLDGGDMVKVFIGACRKVGLTPFISMRLNDGHHLQNAGMKNGSSRWVSRFYEEHPEYRIGSEVKSWDEHVQNWAIPEVRAHKFAFIQELCENYDIDGLELDFMRHSSYFQLDKTTVKQRIQIMSGFISKVRGLLDRTAAEGKHRWLCVRVPCHLAAHHRLGINLKQFVSLGVEMVNLSPGFFTEQQTDLAEIRRLLPHAALYIELTHSTSIGKKVSNSGGNNFTFCRTTDEQFYTGAHLAYDRGADGISTFNFVYYREHGAPGCGPFNEPPFHVLKHLSDPKWLAKQPQDYIIGNVGDVPHIPERQIPKKLKPGEKAILELDMAPPIKGWTEEGKLLIYTDEPLEGHLWDAELNGSKLKLSKDFSEPYPSPYSTCLEPQGHLLAWEVPIDLLNDGQNRLVFCQKSGEMPFFEKLLDTSNTLIVVELAVK